MGERVPYAFINYRREDTAGVARYIFEMIEKRFGRNRAFLDVACIESGVPWPARIRERLASSTVALALIGPNWLRVTDRYNRRRIDMPDDWVRQELASALQMVDEGKTHVIPALLLDTSVPDREALDDPALANLRMLEACKLRDDAWHDDVTRLMSRLEQLGFEKIHAPPNRYPVPQVQVREIRAQELLDTLTRLPGWGVKPNDRDGKDLFKSYEFAHFSDAIAFMHEAAPYITRTQHHPTWTNKWRTVNVWLTTWDIGSQISPLDIDLAQHLEEVRARFPAG